MLKTGAVHYGSVGRSKFHQSFSVRAAVPKRETAKLVTRRFVGRTSAGVPITCDYQDVAGRDLVDCVLYISIEVVLVVVGCVERYGVDRDDGDVGHHAFKADARDPGGNRGPA